MAAYFYVIPILAIGGVTLVLQKTYQKKFFFQNRECFCLSHVFMLVRCARIFIAGKIPNRVQYILVYMRASARNAERVAQRVGSFCNAL